MAMYVSPWIHVLLESSRDMRDCCGVPGTVPWTVPGSIRYNGLGIAYNILELPVRGWQCLAYITMHVGLPERAWKYV